MTALTAIVHWNFGLECTRGNELMSRLAGRSLGHYRVEKLIGAGGMGEVYEAEDLHLGRRVALKVLPAAVAGDRERLARFTREARALAALNHPGIVTIFSVDEVDGEHFLTMELVQGSTLAASIPPEGMAPSRFLEVAVALADALAAAHERGLVHRDLKPANIMLTADGRLKVLDFGLAKLLPRAGDQDGTATLDKTADDAVLGTLPYMAPEQLAGRPADIRSDLFALGVVLYEMASGRHPFAAPTAAAIVAAVMHQIPASLSIRNRTVPPELERLVARCMEKDPSRRPASASEVRASLAAIRLMVETPTQTISAASVPQVPSVAVLPFADMSPARDQEYFCDGIAEEIINALAQLEGLRVTARTSSFSFKGKLDDVREIGRRLTVDAVLEGSVRKAGDRLRITVQLVGVADGYHIWSQRFDRGNDDIFAVQDEISLGVVEKLKVKLLAGESGVFERKHEPVPEAYNLYLKGRFFFNRRGPDDVQRAIAHFEKAIVADPVYPLPHVGIAETFFILGLWGFLPPRQVLGRVKVAASRAIELDDSVVEAHILLGCQLALHEHDWRGARPHFEHGGKFLPFSTLGRLARSLYDMAAGRRREVLETARLYVEVEPLSAISYTQAANFHVGVGDFDGASILLEKALELDAGMRMALPMLGLCRAVQGRLEEAADLLRQAVEKGLPAGYMYLPAVLVLSGRTADARETVEVLEKAASERYVWPLARALAWAALDERERCLGLLADAEAEGSPMFTLTVLGPGGLALTPTWLQEWFEGRRLQMAAAIREAGGDPVVRSGRV